MSSFAALIATPGMAPALPVSGPTEAVAQSDAQVFGSLLATVQAQVETKPVAKAQGEEAEATIEQDAAIAVDAAVWTAPQPLAFNLPLASQGALPTELTSELAASPKFSVHTPVVPDVAQVASAAIATEVPATETTLAASQPAFQPTAKATQAVAQAIETKVVAEPEITTPASKPVEQDLASTEALPAAPIAQKAEMSAPIFKAQGLTETSKAPLQSSTVVNVAEALPVQAHLDQSSGSSASVPAASQLEPKQTSDAPAATPVSAKVQITSAETQTQPLEQPAATPPVSDSLKDLMAKASISQATLMPPLADRPAVASQPQQIPAETVPQAKLAAEAMVHAPSDLPQVDDSMLVVQQDMVEAPEPAPSFAPRTLDASPALTWVRPTLGLKPLVGEASQVSTQVETPSAEILPQPQLDGSKPSVETASTPAAPSSLASSLQAQLEANKPAALLTSGTAPQEGVDDGQVLLNAANGAPQFQSGLTTEAQSMPGSNLLQSTIETTAQISAQILRKLDGRTTRFDMTLTPEALGQVDVNVEIGSDGQVTARLAFDNPAAALELRARADELRRQLQEAGLQLSQDGLEFAQRDPSSGSGGGAFDRSSDRRAFAGAAKLNSEADIALAPQPAQWAALSQTPDRVDVKV